MGKTRSQLWQEILLRVVTDYHLLPVSEKQWIATRLDQIALLQRQLQELFTAGDGDNACRLCQGDCCAKGHNHMTLANLLSYIHQELSLPPADFSRTCPFLCEQGCLLAIESRPYNCITFICDTIEDALTDQDKQQFYDLDQQLRELYQEFSRRYLGAAMTGLLLQTPRLAGQSFFTLR